MKAANKKGEGKGQTEIRWRMRVSFEIRKNASSDRMKERMREIEERNVIGRDKS